MGLLSFFISCYEALNGDFKTKFFCIVSVLFAISIDKEMANFSVRCYWTATETEKIAENDYGKPDICLPAGFCSRP